MYFTIRSCAGIVWYYNANFVMNGQMCWQNDDGAYDVKLMQCTKSDYSWVCILSLPFIAFTGRNKAFCRVFYVAKCTKSCQITLSILILNIFFFTYMSLIVIAKRKCLWLCERTSYKRNTKLATITWQWWNCMYWKWRIWIVSWRADKDWGKNGLRGLGLSPAWVLDYIFVIILFQDTLPHKHENYMWCWIGKCLT